MGTGGNMRLLLVLGAVAVLQVADVRSTPRSCDAQCANGIDDKLSLLEVTGQDPPGSCFMQDVEFLGSNFGSNDRPLVSSAEDCRNRCSRRNHCIAFTFYSNSYNGNHRRRECLFKRGPPNGWRVPKSGRVPGAISGLNSDFMCSACLQRKVKYVPNAHVVALTTPTANERLSSSIEECQMKCSGTDGCRFVSWNMYSTDCLFLRTADATKTPANIQSEGEVDAGYISAPRVCTGQANKCFMADVDFERGRGDRNWIKTVNAKDETDCQTQCNDELYRDCVAFVFYTKRDRGANNCKLMKIISSLKNRPNVPSVVGPRCCCGY